MDTINFNKVTFTCPNCEHVNEYRFYKAPIGEDQDFVYCDDESGGCGAKIMLSTHVTVDIKVLAYLIPGKDYSKATIQPPYDLFSEKEVNNA